MAAAEMKHGEMLNLLTYDRWANRECFAVLRASPSELSECWQLLAHTVAVHGLFLDRIHHDRPPTVWPEIARAEIAIDLDAAYGAWCRLFRCRPHHNCRAHVHYTNSKGERWANTVDDTAIHVVVHSAYHRGQIALLLGRAGLKPPYTDFIHWSRAIRNDADASNPGGAF